MRSSRLLILTAFAEGGTALLLLLRPALLFALLFGWRHAAVETLLIGRVAGAGLLGIAVACWLARHDSRTAAQLGLLAGLLIYNVAAALLLGFAGAVLRMVGIALWPAVVYHVALTAWCAAGLPRRQAREHPG